MFKKLISKILVGVIAISSLIAFTPGVTTNAQEITKDIKVMAAGYTGWDEWGCYYENGISPKGWKYIDGYWYYFNTPGYPVKYSFEIGGVNYSFDSNGHMQTGWITDGFLWKYYESNGAQKKGWFKYNGSWYYLNPYMAYDDKATIDGKKYCFDKSGRMVTGWYKYGNYTWYYANPDGSLHTGWLKDGGKWYYFDPEYNYMETYYRKINGVEYRFNDDGSLR